MTKGKIIGIVLGSIALVAIIGISISSSTKKAIDEGNSNEGETSDKKAIDEGNSNEGETSEDSEPVQPPMPKLIKQNPDGSQVWENPDGNKITYTLAQVKERAKKAVSGRGADGWAS